MERIDVQQMTFGVEIECTVIASAFVAAGMSLGAYHVGSPVPGHPGWTAQRDGSLRTSDSDRTTVEFVSPVLKGAAGIASLRSMVETLSRLGAKVNRSCGFHVHVGWTGDAAALRRLVHHVAHLEPGLWAAQGSFWRQVNSSFCRSTKENCYLKMTCDRIGAGTAAVETIEQVAASLNRYAVLNLTNLINQTRKRTVEFRLFAGTTNVDKMIAYIQICLGIVQKAIEVGTVAKWDAEALTPKSAVRAKGQGLTEVNRMVALLGWTKAFNCTRRGILDETTVQKSLDTIRTMARKYDEQRASGTV